MDTEGERLKALKSYRILDTPPEARFDELAELASDLFDTPIAAISLVDDHRQWFKARVGVDIESTPRDHSFCAHVMGLERDALLVVEDARADPRFADNPHVTGAPNIRFYAAAAITDREGYNLGALAVIDRQPRVRPGVYELNCLRKLARRVADLLEGVRCERKLAEERRLLDMSETLADTGHWRQDLVTGDVVFSAQMYKIFGLDPETFALTRENVYAMLSPSDGADVRKLFLGAIETRRGYEYQSRVRRPDGSRRVIYSRVACDVNDRGEVVGLFGVVEDITELKRAVGALERSEALHKLLSENMADVVTRIRLDGSSDYISPAVRELLGWRPREMAGRPAQAFVWPTDVPLVLGAFRQIAEGCEAVTLQHRAQHRDGHPVWVETRFRALRDDQGRPEAMVAVIRDISDRRALEDELAKARDVAEAANRAKSDFLANMSHELRTPLNGVIGFSRLLAESPDLSDADRRRVLLVRGAGEALNGLINDVLDFSKLEAGGVQLENRPFSLGDMVSEALAMVEPQALENAVALKIDGDDPGVLVGDKYRLRQVLLNFLSNAVKFTTDGTVTVRLSNTAGEGGRLKLRIAVIDQGVGVEPDKLAKLFRRFSQADGSVTRQYGGTGLGLAISRELIELMGGQVGVESRVGEGSTFWFEVDLPRGEAAPRREKGPRGKARFAGRRVLVVDDVALNRELFQEMLQQHDCAADLVDDGAQAVEAVKRGAYDLVLMDVHMPVMDGLAATQAIRAAGFAELPILALTASGAPEQVEACFAAGMDGHLLKPLAPQDLERSLARVFEGQPAADAAEAGPAEIHPEQRARQAFEQSMGTEVTLRLVRMFEDQLAAFFQSAEREPLQAEAHKVAGTSGVLGFLALGEAAKALEEACLAGAPLDPALTRLRGAVEAAAVELAAWRERLSAGVTVEG